MHYLFLIFSLSFALIFSPAGAQIVVNSRTSVVFKGAPGQTLKTQITLGNRAEKPSEATIYCSDYFFSSDGSNIFPPPGSHPRSNCPWIRLSQNSITLPPKKSADIGVTISIPDAPNLEGTYWGVVFVEPVSEKIALPSQKENAKTVYANVRYGIQVVIEIGKTGNYNVKVAKHEVVQEEDKRFLKFDVENHGSRFVQLKPSLDLFTKEGQKVREMKAVTKLIYPTCSTQYSFDISELDPGDYSSFLLLDHSEDAIFGGQYSFQIIKPEPNTEKKEDETHTPPPSESLGGGDLPWSEKKEDETHTPPPSESLVGGDLPWSEKKEDETPIPPSSESSRGGDLPWSVFLPNSKPEPNIEKKEDETHV